jgi:hypothetical protein
VSQRETHERKGGEKMEEIKILYTNNLFERKKNINENDREKSKKH